MTIAGSIYVIIVILISALFFISFAYYVLKNVRRKTVYTNTSATIAETLKHIERQNEEIIKLLKEKKS